MLGRVAGRLRGLGLMTRFVLVGVAIEVLVGASALWYAEARITGIMLGHLAARAMDQVELGIRDSVTAADFEPPFTSDRLDDLAARLDPLLARAQQQGSGIIRLKLFARDGTIIYSDQPALRGQPGASTKPLFRAALAGTVGSELSSLSSPGNADLKARYGGALDVYVPFILDGRVAGVYEIYQDITPLRPVRTVIWSAVVVGCVVLLGALLVVVRGAATQIRRYQAEREQFLQQAAEADALRELDRLKNQLLTTMSHELRTPLTLVIGYAELLAIRLNDFSPAQTRLMLGEIQMASETLARLIDDLLDFSRLERGELLVQARPVDLVPVLRSTAHTFRLVPGGERLVAELPETLPAHADPARMNQVVGNLLSNAFRYAPAGPIVLRAGRRNGEIWIDVVDQGAGIPREEQPRVWEKLYRGPNVAGLNIARGFGMGLPMVKALVEAQGGRVTLDSPPGQGCTFRVILPAIRHSAPAAHPAAADLDGPPSAPAPETNEGRLEDGRQPSAH